MITLSEEMARAVARGLEPVHLQANPLRRGPIVLATDGTSDAGAPVIAAELLATRLGLPVEVLTVLEPSPTLPSGPDGGLPLDPVIDDTRRTARERSVRDYVGRFSGRAAPPHIDVRLGHVATEIARFARERSATIVVMGSAPHRRFQHVVSGERVSQVLHDAPCPVLSVPPTFTALPHAVVTAVDFGPASVRAALASLLVVADGGTVTLMHIVPPPVGVSWLRIVSDEDLAVNLHALFDILLEEIGSSIPDGVNVETRLIPGDTVDKILASPSQMSADLIAIGTHGASPVARLFLGSVAASVLRGATQPVLVSPPPRP